jgi:poly-gamma-glutamate capsule biosynthesis protein CapA/YwtB (metallophosphatase superfamily)
MNGDLLWHDALWSGARTDARRQGRTGKDAYDFAPALAGIEPVVADADLAICHEEVSLAPRGGPYQDYPLFAAPPQVVGGIKRTGYDLCTTASNHSLDHGFAGLRRTIAYFEAAGILTTGTARSRAESRQTAIYRTADGIRIAVITAATHLNGLTLPDDKPWAVNMIDPADLEQRARKARSDGADIVLVALHSGDEFTSEVNADQRFLARRLTAVEAIDLVYCHSAHVVQPWTKVNGKWVIYGLGNTLAQHETPDIRGYDGVTARFTFRESAPRRFRVVEAEYIPTMVTRWKPDRPARIRRISTALERADPTDRRRLLDSRRRTREVVRRLDPPGLTEG